MLKSVKSMLNSYIFYEIILLLELFFYWCISLSMISKSMAIANLFELIALISCDSVVQTSCTFYVYFCHE